MSEMVRMSGKIEGQFVQWVAEVVRDGRVLKTYVGTPGHEGFSEMLARGRDWLMNERARQKSGYVQTEET